MSLTATSLPHSRPLVMGILNVTPDSFSDGGQYADTNQAIEQGLDLWAQGADILDIGGESTRPGAQPVSEAGELDRVLPVIEGLKKAEPDCVLSIDTMKPAVAQAAVQAGAWMWNDVNALQAEGALDMAVELECAVCLMHMAGEPRTMQNNPQYEDVVLDVTRFLGQRAGRALAHGVQADRIWLDPGIGFGKTLAHNLALMAALPQLTRLDFPILFGASRKRFIAVLDDHADDPADRLGGSLASALHAMQCGVSILRVHDVRQTVQALKVTHAIKTASSDHSA